MGLTVVTWETPWDRFYSTGSKQHDPQARIPRHGKLTSISQTALTERNSKACFERNLTADLAPVSPWGKTAERKIRRQAGKQMQNEARKHKPLLFCMALDLLAALCSPAGSHRPCLRRLNILTWSRAIELCSPAGQNHVPGLPSLTRSGVPASYHTYPPSTLCPGEHPAYRRPQHYQISRQGARPAPKCVCCYCCCC